MRVARNVRVNGIVQGVFYRVWARDHAAEIGVAGWIRNCPDGSVEGHLEGEPDAVLQMIDTMREGPPHARVDDVQIADAELEGSSSFEVRH